MRRLESHESFTADTRVYRLFHNTILMNFTKPCLPVNQKSIILLKNHREIGGVVAFSGQS